MAPTPAPGPQGFQDTHATAEAVAAALSDWGTETGAIEVAVCSTGLIGDRLPMDKVLAGVTEIVHEMAGGLTGGEEAARAIMTTDTVPKQVALHHTGNWTVGGMAKGAGMLAPSLATMLCVITTDAVADAAALDHALRRATAPTFDRLDVDGSCSTNDTVLLLASGASEIAPSQSDLDDAVLRVCDDLCAQLQADAEGVTKRIVVTVTGAAIEDDALTAARVVARDSLVKTALFGSDPNWGRVLAAVGMAPVSLEPDRISVSFNGSPVCVDGVGAPGARDVDLSGDDIDVTIDLGRRRRSGQRSAPPTCPTATSKRTRPTAHDRRSRPSRQGRRARRGAAVAQAAARQDRRGQVRRQRHDRRHPAGARSPPTWCSCATAASIPSWCTAAVRRSARCSNGSASQAISRAASGSPHPRCSTSRGWCCSVRSAASWST